VAVGVDHTAVAEQVMEYIEVVVPTAVVVVETITMVKQDFQLLAQVGVVVLVVAQETVQVVVMAVMDWLRLPIVDVNIL
jgi:hypothetical protein